MSTRRSPKPFPRLIPRGGDLHTSAGQARSQRARARASRALGERAHVRAAPRAKHRWAAIQFHRRPRHGEQEALAVHTAWGRTLKDVFQRYKAMQGFHQRYQNGFDCQGLWIEVGVERELGLNSKREIEEYGLAEFARRCREKVVWSAQRADRGLQAPRPVDGLGRRLLHVLGHEHRVHLAVPQADARARLPLQGPSLDRVVPALRDVDLAARALAGRGVPGQVRSLALRTPASSRPAGRVARRVDDDALDASRQRGRGGRARGRVRACARTASGWPSPVIPTRASCRRSCGSELVGARYRGPFDDLAPAAEVEHRVIPWDEVSLEEGSGIVHIAPGAGQEDFELGRVHGLPVLVPVDESGRFYDSYGWLHGALDHGSRRSDRRLARGEGRPARGWCPSAPLPALLAL